MRLVRTTQSCAPAPAPSCSGVQAGARRARGAVPHGCTAGRVCWAGGGQGGVRQISPPLPGALLPLLLRSCAPCSAVLPASCRGASAIKGQHVHRGARLIVKPTPPYTLCPQWFYFDSLESMPDSPLAPEDMAPQACAARTWRVAQEGGPRTAWRAVLTAVLLLLPSLCAAAGQPLRRSSGGVWAGGAAAAGSAQDLSGKALGGQLSMMRAWRSLPRPAAPHPHTTPRRAQVGAGALGCEFLKNVALMGVSCGEACPPRASVCARA